MINAAIKQREVDERILLDDTQVLAAMEKMLKQRKDSISQYEAAKREDLAQIERDEVVVIQSYLPQQMGADELSAEVAKAIAESGAAGPQDMGKVMACAQAAHRGTCGHGAGFGAGEAAIEQVIPPEWAFARRSAMKIPYRQDDTHSF